MSWGTIATWRMANEGVEKASTILEENGTAGDAVEKLINTVEAYPYYKLWRSSKRRRYCTNGCRFHEWGYASSRSCWCN